MRNGTAVTSSSGGAGAALRTRLGSLRITRRRGALGLPEFIALAASALLLLAALLAYFFMLVPQRSRRQSLDDEGKQLQRQLQSQQDVLGGQRSTEQRVAEILTSLDGFQTKYLGQSSVGTKTVIEELNRLILKNGLRISGGVNFTQLMEAVPGAENGQQQQKRSGSGEENAQRIVQSVFPGIGVTLTVEGTYPNLRRFISDIEADPQFLVINTVELEGVTDSNAELSATAPAPVVAHAPVVGRTGTGIRAASPQAEGMPPVAQVSTPSRGALVSLRLDMAAYFRRAGAGGE